MKFEANTLEEAYEKATKEFDTSISNLNIEVIQQPSKGLFGLFKKSAIIEATPKEISQNKEPIKEPKEEIKETKSNEIKSEVTPKTEEKKVKEVNKKIEKYEEKENLSIEEVVKIAKKEINELFELSCFDIDSIEVKVYDDETILFEINGEDSALLIGKEGYRYNALATLIYSWISQKYGYRVRLEIASFLENQEEMMRKYLEPTIREIEQTGRCKTKPFDGVLAYLAVEILRSEFPHKYVAIKKNRNGENYIIVNDFLNKND